LNEPPPGAVSQRFSALLGALKDGGAAPGGQWAHLSTTKTEGADMNNNSSKELIRSTAVAIGAWLIVIAAGVNEHVEGAATVIHIAYQVE
jgi:hypothetical protein